MKEGMDEYITKPIETTELLYILNKFLAQKTSAEAKTLEPKMSVQEKQNIQEVNVLENDIVEKSELSLSDSIEDLDIFDTIQDDEKKILIAKKFLLAQRILAKVLDNLEESYDVLDEHSTLEEALSSGSYDIVFTDSNMITEGISNTNENVAIISSIDTDKDQSITVQKGENITTTASKEEIAQIITKYRG
jgi:CheY-like chemotaxis protein